MGDNTRVATRPSVASSRLAAGLILVSLLSLLAWLDHHRGGPSTILSGCNLMLTRSDKPAADILLAGSSRIGTAIDPVLLETLQNTDHSGAPKTVERIAIGNNHLRLTYALLQGYFQHRGYPGILVLETTFLTRRTLENLAPVPSTQSAESELYKRDLNLMSYAQILKVPAVGVPFDEPLEIYSEWSIKLKGLLLRSGALLYQALKQLLTGWNTGLCDKTAWTREPHWPANFAFSMGDAQVDPSSIKSVVEPDSNLEAAATRLSTTSVDSERKKETYAYHFEAEYRQAELGILDALVRTGARHQMAIVLLPLTLKDQNIEATDLRVLEKYSSEQLQVFNLYDALPHPSDKLWYDEAHVDPGIGAYLLTHALNRFISGQAWMKTLPIAEYQ